MKGAVVVPVRLHLDGERHNIGFFHLVCHGDKALEELRKRENHTQPHDKASAQQHPTCMNVMSQSMFAAFRARNSALSKATLRYACKTHEP